ncbi:MAG: histidine kinase, partial [Tolypothrix sp. Co-bin9]|nr:histidine kinase [Tolypothrix sp. Co-bin9]
NTAKLRDLLNWAEQVTAGSQGDFKPVAKRAAAIFFTLANELNINIVRDLAYDIITNLDITFVRALVRAVVRELDINLTRDFNTVLEQSFRLAKEFKTIKVFKDANLLITRLEALRANIPDANHLNKVDQTFRNRLSQTWLTTLNLNLEMINLSPEELQALENYLYANYLIIQCKESAVRVSPKTWQGIEARMLLLPAG